MWNEITNSFPNFNGTTVDVWEWISNFIPHVLLVVWLLIRAGIEVNPRQSQIAQIAFFNDRQFSSVHVVYSMIHALDIVILPGHTSYDPSWFVKAVSIRGEGWGSLSQNPPFRSLNPLPRYHQNIAFHQISHGVAAAYLWRHLLDINVIPMIYLSQNQISP